MRDTYEPWECTAHYSAYLEWIQTASDYPVITRADGTQEEHPYRQAAWNAFSEEYDRA